MIVFRKSKLFADNEKKNDKSGLVLGLGLAGSGAIGAGSGVWAQSIEEKDIKKLQLDYYKFLESASKDRSNYLKKAEENRQSNLKEYKETIKPKLNRIDEELDKISKDYFKDIEMADKSKGIEKYVEELDSLEEAYKEREKPLLEERDRLSKESPIVKKIENFNKEYKRKTKEYDELFNREKKRYEKDTKKLMTKSNVIRRVGLGLAGVGALGSGLYYYNKKKNKN